MTIAIIDKQPIFLFGLSLYLTAHYENARILKYDSINDCQKFSPDLMPELFIIGFGQALETANLDFIHRISKQKTVRTIAYDEEADYNRAWLLLNAGVNGYLSKENDISELSNGIRQVLKGERFVCSEISNKIHHDNRPLSPFRAKLTNREYEIAKYLIEGMKTSSIAEQVGRKASTISTIKKTIFKKLQVDNVFMLREKIEA